MVFGLIWDVGKRFVVSVLFRTDDLCDGGSFGEVEDADRVVDILK
jgi:hypothetical protein